MSSALVPIDDTHEILVGELVSPAGVLEQLPRQAAAAIAQVPGAALDPFDRLLDSFLDDRPANTARSYETDLRQWGRWCLREAPVEYRIHPLLAGRPHVAAWSKHLRESPSPRTGKALAPASIARKLSALAEFYGYAIDLSVLDRSPVANVKRPKVSDESSTAGLTNDELIALLDVADAHSPRWAALVSVLVFTGVRISEALGTDISDYRYDHGHRVLRVRRKGGKFASVVLPAVTARSLDTLIGDRTSGPIFLSHDGQSRYAYPSAYEQLRRLARRAGIASADLIKPHSLRHGFATAALALGTPLQDVQDALGHRDPRTTRRYDRTRNNLDRSPANALAAALRRP
jgi:integrase/recombinase XerD